MALLNRLLKRLRAAPQLIYAVQEGPGECDSGRLKPPVAIKRYHLVNAQRFGVYIDRVVGEPYPQLSDEGFTGISILLAGGYQATRLTADMRELSTQASRFTLLRPGVYRRMGYVQPNTTLLIFRGRLKAKPAYMLDLSGDQASIYVPDAPPAGSSAQNTKQADQIVI